MKRRIYLDQAATSWPKLATAVDEADRFVRLCGATSGRGTYESSRTADHWVTAARHNLARLLGAADASAVAFCSSGTHALNAAISGLLKPGDRVLTTAIEHNSVLRPLEHWRRTRDVSVDISPCDATGRVDLKAVEQSVKSHPPKWIMLSHASNVTGCIQEVRAVSELAHSCGAKLLLDASQTVGYVPIDMHGLGVDLLASAGHKGLGALSGTGFLLATSELQTKIEPLMFGGTGLASEQLDAVPLWPMSVEVGNLNLPAVVSMAVAAEHWLKAGEVAMGQWHSSLDYFVKELRARSQNHWSVIGHEQESVYLPVVSLQLNDWDIHEAAAVLDANFGVEVRSGFHCAALVHHAIGTHERGGTLRFSLGHDTAAGDLDEALDALVALHAT